MHDDIAIIFSRCLEKHYTKELIRKHLHTRIQKAASTAATHGESAIICRNRIKVMFRTEPCSLALTYEQTGLYDNKRTVMAVELRCTSQQSAPRAHYRMS